MTLANRLTMLRVVLAATVFIALMADEPRWHIAAFALFLAAIVTDWLDGWLARRTGTVSPFGKVADPIADKILVIGTLIALIGTQELGIPLWAVFLIIIRELVIGGIRIIAASQGKILAADKWGKLKTAVQLAVILLILAVVVFKDRGIAAPWMVRSAYPLTVLCAVLALSSLGVYLRQYRGLLEKSWS